MDSTEQDLDAERELQLLYLLSKSEQKRTALMYNYWLRECRLLDHSDVDSRAPKKPNQHREVGEGYREMFLKETPMPQHLRTFRQLYRMTPDCYKFMKGLIMAKTDVFHTTEDSFGTPGVVDDIKLLSALYHLASGAPFTAIGAFYDISNGSAARFFDNFLIHGRNALLPFLAEVTPEEAVEVVAVHEKEHGLPGYLGSLDCCRWMWEMCPDSNRVAHIGKEGTSLILEAVASNDLRVLWYNFGSSGSYNDLNVLKKSRIITREVIQKSSSHLTNIDNGKLEARLALRIMR